MYESGKITSKCSLLLRLYLNETHLDHGGYLVTRVYDNEALKGIRVDPLHNLTKMYVTNRFSYAKLSVLNSIHCLVVRRVGVSIFILYLS